MGSEMCIRDRIPTGQSERGRGRAMVQGKNAGQLSGVKPPFNITRESTGATELRGRIRSYLFTFACIFPLLFLVPQSVVCKDPDSTSGLPTSDEISWDSDYTIGAVLSPGGGLGV